ncbi:hypothetical protein ACE1SV_73690 [Streptomyces sp. E-15]
MEGRRSRTPGDGHGAHFVFRPQPTIYLLWALGDEETRRLIEAAHEYAIERVLEWIEDEVTVIRYGTDGIYRVRPPGGLVAARFRHYEARSGRPLLHDHLLLSVKGQRLDGKWGSVHSTALLDNTVAASALYNELVAAEVCEALGLATEPRTVTPGRRPVMEIVGVPHELIRWTSRRSDQIAACLTELEHEYVTAVDDDGEPRFLPVVSERARAKLNRIAAGKTRPPKQSARPLAQLRAWWKASAILTSGVAADVINSLLEHARAAAVAIRARVAAVVDVALAAVDVAATVFVMNDRGRFHRRHLLAEARRHLALVLRGRRRDPGLDDERALIAVSAASNRSKRRDRSWLPWPAGRAGGPRGGLETTDAPWAGGWLTAVDADWGLYVPVRRDPVTAAGALSERMERAAMATAVDISRTRTGDAASSGASRTPEVPALRSGRTRRRPAVGNPHSPASGFQPP